MSTGNVTDTASGLGYRRDGPTDRKKQRGAHENVHTVRMTAAPRSGIDRFKDRYADRGFGLSGS